MTCGVHELTGDTAFSALFEALTWPGPQSLGYHHPAYQRLLTAMLDDELLCLAAIGAGGKLRGVLPYRRKRSRHGWVINAMPFFGSNALVTAAPGSHEVLGHLLENFVIRARDPAVFSAALYTPFGIQPLIWRSSLRPDGVISKFTQYLGVSSAAPWPAKREADLRRAHARGYAVQHAGLSDSAEVSALYAAACADAGIRIKPRAFIDGTLEISTRLGEAAPMRWLTARRNGRITAALLYGLGAETASYILPCAAAAERPHQPNALLLDAAIADARSHGLRYWNFESSPAWDDPVFKYKERWGARPAAFDILLFYGHAALMPPVQHIEEARADCPYYFVAPLGQVTGTWPPGVRAEDHIFPSSFNAAMTQSCASNVSSG